MVDVVTILLAIASITFAYIQKLDSSDLKHQTESILSSASTGYVAEFPHSIPVITNIMRSVCSDLGIMADLAGYGEYSDPQAFYWYMHSILDLRHRTVKDNLNAGHCIGKTIDKGLNPTRVSAIRLLLFSPDDMEAALRKEFTKEGLAKSLADTADTSGRDSF